MLERGLNCEASHLELVRLENVLDDQTQLQRREQAKREADALTAQIFFVDKPSATMSSSDEDSDESDQSDGSIVLDLEGVLVRQAEMMPPCPHGVDLVRWADIKGHGRLP